MAGGEKGRDALAALLRIRLRPLLAGLTTFCLSAIQAVLAVSLVLLVSVPMPLVRQSVLKKGSTTLRRRTELWRAMCRRFTAFRLADQWATATTLRSLECSSMQPAQLPPEILDAGSPEGRVITETAERLDYALMRSGERQGHPAWCWRATVASLLNAFGREEGADRQEGPGTADARRINQSDVLAPVRLGEAPHSLFACQRIAFLDGLCLPSKLQSLLLERLSLAGMAPRALAELLSLHGLNATFVEGDDASPQGQLQFLSDLRDCMNSIGNSSNVRRMVVSFSRATLGMLGSGHFAPVAGYNPKRGRILLLDSNSWRYPKEQWVKSETLWEACCTTTGYGFRRGYIIVGQRMPS